MENAEQLETLHKIEKEISTLSKRTNSNLYSTQTTYSYVGNALSLCTYLFPKGIHGKVLTFVINNWIAAKLLPNLGHWRSRRLMKSFEIKIRKKMDEWWDALRQTEFNEKERLELTGELNTVLEKISKQQDLDQNIRNIIQQLMIKILNTTLTVEIGGLINTVEKFRITDFKLLQQNLNEIKILLHKIENKKFSIIDPIYFELDEEDMAQYQLTDKNKPYRKIYAFKDPAKDYFEEIQEIKAEKNRILLHLKKLIEYNVEENKVERDLNNKNLTDFIELNDEQIKKEISFIEMEILKDKNKPNEELKNLNQQIRGMHFDFNDTEITYATKTGLTPKNQKESELTLKQNQKMKI